MTQPVRDEDDRDDEKINTIILGMRGVPWMTQNALLYKENGESSTDLISEWKEEDKNEEATLTMHGWELADYIREAISELEDTQDLLREAQAALLAEQETSSPWHPIETAPKGMPILGWCVHEADPYHECSNKLTPYGAGCEDLGHVENGPHVVVWRDDEWEPTDEYGSGFIIPGWWTRYGSDGEEYANPTHWMPLPNPPSP